MKQLYPNKMLKHSTFFLIFIYSLDMFHNYKMSIIKEKYIRINTDFEYFYHNNLRR